MKAIIVSIMLLLMAPPALSITVYPRYGFERLTVRVSARVVPDRENVAACLTIDSGDYFRQSCFADPPGLIVQEYRDLPAGDYIATISIERRDHSVRQASTPFTSLSRDSSTDPN